MRLLISIWSIIFLSFMGKVNSQVTIADHLPGCLQDPTFVFTECDGTPGVFEVQGGQIVVNDIVGTTCCGGSPGGNSASYFEYEDIDISSYMNVVITFEYSAAATAYEDNSSTPISTCANANPPDNSHDQIVFQYSLNGGPFINSLYVHGTNAAAFTGTWTSAPLNGNTLKIRVIAANKADDEIFYFDNLDVRGTPKTLDAGPDKSTCNTNPVNLMGVGVGTWSGGTGTFSNVNSPTSTYTPSGLEVGNTVVLTYQGKPGTGGCAGTYPPPSDDMNLTISTAPTVTINVDETELCQGECSIVSISVLGGTPPYNISGTFKIGALPPIPIPGGIPLPSINETFNICYEFSTFPLPQWDPGTKTLRVPATAAGTIGLFNLISINDANNCSNNINEDFSISFLPQPQGSPYTLTECADNTGYAIFDLTQADPFILGSELGFVTYYTDAALTDVATNPFTSNGQTLYAVITNSDGCISVPVSLVLEVKPPGDVGPVTLSPNPLNICDDDGVLGEEVSINVGLSSNSTYVIEYALNVGGNITTNSVSVLGPNAVLDLTINADASLIIISITQGNECPDVSNLGGVINISYKLKPDVPNLGPIVSCNTINLPPLNVTNPSGITGYFGGPNATGMSIAQGTAFSSNATIYAFSGTPGCSDESKIEIMIGGVTTYAEPKDTAICGQYILPSILGTGISALAGYYTLPLGGGIKYKVGDTIKSSTTLYLFESTNPACQTNNPDIKITITASPEIKLDSTVFACESYKLPKITGINLSGNEAYFSNSMFTGIADSVGTVVNKLDTFYLRAGTGLCMDKDTLIVNVRRNTIYSFPTTITECNNYELQPILGTNVGPNAAYYSQPNGKGIIYKPGDIISQPTLLFIFDTTNFCQINTPQFQINLAPGPEIFAISDVIACQTFALPTIPGINLIAPAYFTGSNGTGQKYAEGLIITQTDTLYAFDSNGSCSNQKSFIVTIDNPGNAGQGTITGLCLNEDNTVDLFKLLKAPFDLNGSWTTNSNFNISNPNQVLIPQNSSSGSFLFTYTVTPIVCPQSVASTRLNLIDQPNAGNDNNVVLCKGSTDKLNLFSLLGTTNQTGKIISSFPISDPLNINIASLDTGKYQILYSLRNFNSQSNTECVDTASLFINIQLGSNAGSNAVRTVCKGATVNLTSMLAGQSGIGIFKEVVNTGKLVGSNFNTTDLNPNTYTILHIIPANGSCASDTSELKIEVKNLISAGPDVAKEFCSLEAVNLNTLIGSQNAGGNFSFSGFGATLSNNGLFTPAQAAKFEIKYIVGDGVICPTDEASVTLTFIQKPTVSLNSPTSICNGEDIEAIVKGSIGFSVDVILQNEAQYNAGNLNSNLSKRSLLNDGADQKVLFDKGLFLPNQKYFVSIKSASLGACSYNVDLVKQFTILTSPTREIKGKYCEGQEVVVAGVKFNQYRFKDTLIVDAPNGCDSILFINLTFNKSSSSSYIDTTCNTKFEYKIGNETFSFSNPKGTALLGIKNAVGCDSTVNVELSFIEPKALISQVNAPCEEGKGELVLNSLVGFNSITSIKIDELDVNIPSIFPFTYSVSPGQRKIIIIDDQGCELSQNIIVESDKITGTIVESIVAGGSKQLSLQSSRPIISYDWSPLDIVDCNDCPVVNVIGFGEVKLDYVYGEGCTGTATYKIIKEILKEIYFPNILSIKTGSKFFPQKPEDYSVVAENLSIYDRWGNLVWSKNNFDIGVPDNGWDGEFNGKNIVPGVYIYTLSTLDIDKIKKVWVGNITIIE